MKNVFLIFCFVTLSRLAVAGFATPNTGVTWNLDSLVARSGGVVTGTFPVYTASDTVTVSANDRLVVQAGSTLKFTSKGLTVFGVLKAIGTPTARITFTGVTATPGSWTALRFEDSSIDSLCILDYCVIEYATAGVNCITASPTVTHSTLRYNGSLTGSGSYGIQCFQSNAIIRYDSLYNNSQYGINITTDSSPIIEYCVIANNNVQNTGAKNQISIGTQGTNSPIVRFNEISGGTSMVTGGISVSSLFTTSAANPVIEGNYIHNNAYGIACVGANINAIIKGNRIEFNNTPTNPNLGGSGINVNGTATPVITRNIIKGNLWGVTIQSTARPNLGDLTNADTTDDGRNVFIANGHNDTTFALYNNTPNAIKAQNNYWGTANADSVALFITDSTDVPTLGRVTYLPFLTTNPTLSVADAGSHRQPANFALEQNYPNPFNPTTVISYQLSVSSPVTLKVYDVLGREVATLVNEHKAAGSYAVAFDATKFASGIYFYQLRSATAVQTRKMLLVK